MDHLYYLCLEFFMLLRLVIDASWSHAVKGLTTWLLFVMFVMFNCVFFFTFPFGILGHMWYLII